MKKMNRRNFVKLAAASGAAVVTGAGVTQNALAGSIKLVNAVTYNQYVFCVLLITHGIQNGVFKECHVRKVRETLLLAIDSSTEMPYPGQAWIYNDIREICYR